MDLSDHLPHFSPTTHLIEIDGTKARSLRGFYPRIAKALIFPDYFGKNLDALSDCLASLEHVGSLDVVLLIRHFDHFLDKEKPEKRRAAIEVLQYVEDPKNRYDTVKFRVVGLR